MIALLTWTVFSLSITNCTDTENVEYVSPPERYADNLIRFKTSMVYLHFEDQNMARDFGFAYAYFNYTRIKRFVISHFLVNDSSALLEKYPKEQINENMKFRVLGSYWVRKSLLERELTGEVQYLMLQDENDVLSACPLTTIEISSLIL